MLSNQARRFLERYPQTQPQREKLASLALNLVRRVIEPLNLDIHLIDSRIKAVKSALGKIRRKRYGSPARQLTDQVGVRVITYFQDDVDKVAMALRTTLEIDEGRSVDKRQQLDVQQFGYRSVHLIARFGTKVREAEFRPFVRKWFEIQVRSILEHAWAEIEHEANYKAGTQFPRHVLRRFGAIAGSLEILEGEFLALRKESDNLVDIYRDLYTRNIEGEKDLDAARLRALLEARRPTGLSWRRAAAEGSPFPPRIEAVCVEALRAVGIRRGRELDKILRGRKFFRAVQKFAAVHGLDPDEISHFAATVIAIAIADKDLLTEQYPELTEDPGLRVILTGV